VGGGYRRSVLGTQPLFRYSLLVTDTQAVEQTLKKYHEHGHYYVFH
jgi:hypothetical protein